MRTRRLPGTDLDLSVVGFGCWPLGGEHWGPSDPDAQEAAVREALDRGINWFDTAPLYGRGRADEVLVRALGPRLDEVILATKVGPRLDGTGPDGPGPRGHLRCDARPAHILADCEASLRRLREPLDLLQLHWPGSCGAALEDTAAALDDLVDRGWIRHWGVCNHGPEAVRRLARAGRLRAVQAGYSLVRREVEAGLLPTCRELGVGLLAYEGLCRGLLSGKHRTLPRFGPDDLRRHDPRFRGRGFAYGRALARDLARAGERLGVSASALALGWVASRPGVCAVIAGCRSPAQVRENAAAARVAASPGVVERVERLAALHGRPPW